MISLFDLNFTLFTLFDILGLYLCSFILKKYVKNFPNKLIPILDILLSIVTSLIYVTHRIDENGFPLYFFLLTGIINGLSSVGLHQVIKQTKTYFLIKRRVESFKEDKRKIIN